MFNKILPLILSRAKSIWLTINQPVTLPKKTVEFTLYINDEMARDLQMNDINTTLYMNDTTTKTLTLTDELPISLSLPSSAEFTLEF